MLYSNALQWSNNFICLHYHVHKHKSWRTPKLRIAVFFKYLKTVLFRLLIQFFRVVTKMVDLLFYLLALDQNKNLFLEVQGAALLELAKKMHKKNVALCAHLDSLLCVLA